MKLFALVFSLLCYHTIQAQGIDKIINPVEVKRIESILSDDKMEGRRTFTPGNARAATFIAEEFTKIGLQTFTGLKGFKQEFELTDTITTGNGTLNKMPLKKQQIVALTSKATLTITEQSGFETDNIKSSDNVQQKITGYINAKKNYLVVVDTSFTSRFNRFSGFKRLLGGSAYTILFVLTTEVPKEYNITLANEITTRQLANVVGMIPGKGKKNEYVVFSGHYDHLGIGKPVDGDSIFNGANDDAAGTTAVIMLAKYFKSVGSQERTLIFAAFTGEEVGGFGSKHFSRQLKPAEVMAMFNIEMIGTDSKWGKNSAYITGYEKTDLGKILEKNLEGSGFKFYPDPYPEQDLFYRSDNATLARLGVAAHTISTSKMDSEKYYHTVKDEIGTLDMDNMSMIIKAIAISSKSIIEGKDTPSRVDVKQLR